MFKRIALVALILAGLSIATRADEVVSFTWEVNVEQDMINGTTETLSGSVLDDETANTISNIVMNQPTGGEFLSTYSLTESSNGFIWDLQGSAGFVSIAEWIVGNSLEGVAWTGVPGCSSVPLTPDQVVGLVEGAAVFPPCGDDVTYSAAFIFPGTGDPPIITPESPTLPLALTGMLALLIGYWLKRRHEAAS